MGGQAHDAAETETAPAPEGKFTLYSRTIMVKAPVSMNDDDENETIYDELDEFFDKLEGAAITGVAEVDDRLTVVME